MVAIAPMLETVGASAQEQDQDQVKDSTGTNPVMAHNVIGI
jgi:hypothetical protein